MKLACAVAECDFDAITNELKLTALELGLPEDFAKNRPPFAIVASDTHRYIDGVLSPVREYPWGECIVNNMMHTDFELLR